MDSLSIHTMAAGDRKNRPILFLHGRAFEAKTWQDLGTLELLAQKDCFSVAIDLPGWGKSPEADFIAGNVIESIMTTCNMEKPIIVGPSMGGRIAIEFAIKNPQLVGGLVLIGTVGVQENLSQLNILPESTLIIWGENDHISDPANGTLLHNEITGSKLAVIADTKHACYIEKPDDFHNHLIQFVCN